jgi:hypothetical protein
MPRDQERRVFLSCEVNGGVHLDRVEQLIFRG